MYSIKGLVVGLVKEIGKVPMFSYFMACGA
jgi:hypothetical protein